MPFAIKTKQHSHTPSGHWLHFILRLLTDSEYNNNNNWISIVPYRRNFRGYICPRFHLASDNVCFKQFPSITSENSGAFILAFVSKEVMPAEQKSTACVCVIWFSKHHTSLLLKGSASDHRHWHNCPARLTATSSEYIAAMCVNLGAWPSYKTHIRSATWHGTCLMTATSQNHLA